MPEFEPFRKSSHVPSGRILAVLRTDPATGYWLGSPEICSACGRPINPEDMDRACSDRLQPEPDPFSTTVILVR